MVTRLISLKHNESVPERLNTAQNYRPQDHFGFIVITEPLGFHSDFRA